MYLITILDNITIVFSFITMIAVIFNLFLNIKNTKMQNTGISIEIQTRGQPPLYLAQTIKRRHLTRSEVQGVLANAYCPEQVKDETGEGAAAESAAGTSTAGTSTAGKAEKGRDRYNIPFLASKAFSDRLESVQNGKEGVLVIEVEDVKEFAAFRGEAGVRVE